MFAYPRIILFWISVFSAFTGTILLFLLSKKRAVALLLALWLVPPLVALASMVVGYVAEPWSKEFWATLLSFYPFSIVPFGLYSSCAGLLIALLLEHSPKLAGFSRMTIIVCGSLLGALLGSVLLAAYVVTSKGFDPGSPPVLIPWAIAGATGGAAGGLILALFYASTLSAPRDSSSRNGGLTLFRPPKT